MATRATNLATVPATTPTTTRITTTLFDLVAAVDDAIGSPNDSLVTATVMHLINSAEARFVRSRHKLAIVNA